MHEQKRAHYLLPPTSAKWAGKTEKRHGNRKKSGHVYVTNPQGLGGSIFSEAGPGGEPLGAGLKSAIGFGREWIRLLLNSQRVCRPGAEAHWCCEQRGSVLPLPRLSQSHG